MGEIAEMMLNGEMCEACGVWLHDDGASGFPCYCSAACAGDRGADHYANKPLRFGLTDQKANTIIRSAIKEAAKALKATLPMELEREIERNLRGVFGHLYAADGVIHHDGITKTIQNNLRQQRRKK